MYKVVFCGFGKLGKNCLKELIKNDYKISYIMTHKELDEYSVDTFAEKENIKYSYLDARKNLSELQNTIAKISPDFLISVNYRYILPKEIYSIANYAFNIHGSLLPKYRGRTPHVWSIINGEKYSGITSHLIEETVDTGDIIMQEKIKISDEDTGYTLLKKYEKLYPNLLIKSIEKLINKEKLTKQNEDIASYFGKRTPIMGYIDFRKNANQIIDFVRAQANPYPSAYYYLSNGKKILIDKISISDIKNTDIKIGIIKKIDNSYYVACNNAILKIEQYKIID